jgi:hypothetical protein
MKKILTALLFFFTLVLLEGNHISFAETFHSQLYGFSIDIPDDWSRRQPKKPQTLFTYAKFGSGENLNMNVLSADGLSSIKQISLRQTFHPYYDYVIILQTMYENCQGTDFRHCIYKLKESDLKKKIEGKYKLQYYVFQWIQNERLFTITFTDSEDNFTDNLQTFKKIIMSFQIND